MSNNIFINTCVIGNNYAKNTLLPILKINKKVKIIAVCKKKKDKYDLDYRIFYSWKKMIDCCKPDFAIVAVPPKIQSKVIKYLVLKKTSFFAQKPITYNYKDAEIIYNLIKKSKNIKTAIDLNFLELEPIIFFKKKIKKFLPKKNSFVEIKWLFKSNRHKKNHWKNRKSEGGAMYYNFGFHLFSIIINIFGDIKLVSAKREKNFDLIELLTKTKVKIKIYFSNNYAKKNIFRIKYQSADSSVYELLNTSKDYHGNFKIYKNKKKIYNQLKTNKNINPRQLASSFILNRLLNSIYYKKNKLNENHTYLKISFKVHSIIKDIYKILK